MLIVARAVVSAAHKLIDDRYVYHFSRSYGMKNIALKKKNLQRVPKVVEKIWKDASKTISTQ